jgi:Cu/Ag efflux pump CusA
VSISIFSQYIQDNIEEAVSGVKGENSVKIFGRDLAELERLSQSVKTEIGQVPGVRDPAAFNLIGQPNLVIRIDRAKAARYGISVGDLNAVVQLSGFNRLLRDHLLSDPLPTVAPSWEQAARSRSVPYWSA